MKKKIQVTDLNIDVLRHIMLCVARSPGGSRTFARALSVCKSFWDLENDTEFLISVSFVKQSLSKYPESFWAINGLLTRCAFANNSQAREILGEYLEGQVEVWTKRIFFVEEAGRVAHQMSKSCMAVNTRGRKRAAELATEEYKNKLFVVWKEGRELQDHLRALAPTEI